MKRAAAPARMSCARSWPNERTAIMPEVLSPLSRRPAGRCLTAKVALLAGLAALAMAPATFAQAAQPAAAADAQVPAGSTVDEQVQSLKSDVLDLNRDLFVLEQELLYPANTQVAVFVSMDAGSFFALESVQLKIDGKEVADY